MKNKLRNYLRGSFFWDCMLMQTNSSTYKLLGIISWLCWTTLIYLIYNFITQWT